MNCYHFKMTKEYLDILKLTEIFSNLEHKKLLAISHALEPVELTSDQILFEQDAPSDALYIVVRGVLAINLHLPTGETTNIGIVHRGQTVGEAGLIASQPRSMTVVALLPTVVLKLTKPSFESIFPTESTLLLNTIELIVKRSRKTIRMLNKAYDYKGFIFLPASDNVPFEQFIKNIKHEKTHHLDIVFLSISDFKNSEADVTQISSYLDHIEKTHQNIFYFADVVDEHILDVFCEHSDRLIMVGSGDKPAEIDDLHKQMLINKKAKFSKINLVLLYTENKVPQHTSAWMSIHPFSNFYHIDITKIEHYARLFRYLVGHPIGLVLGGGGTRGWVQIGVIKALMEEKIEIDMVGGTSIGSLVGALFLLYPNYDKFFEVSRHLFEQFKNPLTLKHFVYPVISITDGKVGTYILENEFHDLLIENMPKPYFCISSCIQESHQVIHTQGLLKKWIRASSSIPGIIPPVLDNGKMYVDGGILNYLPVDVMRDMMENKGKIIAVDLSDSEAEEAYNFPLTINFWESILIKLKINKKYKIPEFYSFLDQSVALGSTEKTISNGKLANVLIKPNLKGVPHFAYIKNYDKLIQAGYETTMSKINQIRSFK